MSGTSLQEQETRTETAEQIVYTPRVDILENNDELVLFADVPGVKPEDADVRFENGELILHCRCTPRSSYDRASTVEYGVGDFYRVFTISETIDAGKITAELKHGVLTIHLPKVEQVRPRRIEVKKV